MTSENESATQADRGLESPGRMLTQLRKNKSLTAAEVARRLKYGIRQIDALERDDYARLSGTTFVRGMIRSYSKLLETNPEPILDQFERLNTTGPLTVDLRAPLIPFPDKSRRSTRAYAIFSVVALIVACLIGFELYSGISLLTELEEQFHSPERQISRMEPAKTEATVKPSDSSVAHPEASNQTHMEMVRTVATPAIEARPGLDKLAIGQTALKRISLRFDRESWVEIKQADGKTLLSQLNPAGTEQFIEGVPPFLLTIGNAPSVHVKYEDQSVDLRPHFKVDVARLTLE